MSLNPDLGDIVGDYRFEQVLGEGGFGIVYKATDLSLERPVAVKTLKQIWSNSEEFAQRFRRGAKALARTNHPGIVRVFKTFEWEDRTFLVMEYLEHPTLKEVLIQGKPPIAEALRMAEHMAAAVAHAHAKGVIHRDLKPHNIAVLPDGSIKLFDFGIALMKGSSFQTSTSDGRSFGTPEYMSPEQCLGERVDERTDIYALGVVLYEMLTGRPPFVSPIGDSEAVRYMHRYEPVPPMSRFTEGIPDTVERLTNRALQKSLSDRIPTARGFAAQLKRLRRSEGRGGLSKRSLSIKSLFLRVASCFAGLTVLLLVLAALGNKRDGRDARDARDADHTGDTTSSESTPSVPSKKVTHQDPPSSLRASVKRTSDLGPPNDFGLPELKPTVIPPSVVEPTPLPTSPPAPSPIPTAERKPFPRPVVQRIPSSSPVPSSKSVPIAKKPSHTPSSAPALAPDTAAREAFARASALADSQDYLGAIKGFENAEELFAEKARNRDDQWHLVQACKNAARLCDRMVNKKTSSKVFQSSMAILRNEVLGEGPTDVKSAP